MNKATIEEVAPLFFNPTIIEKPFYLKRFSKGGSRFYFVETPNKEFIFNKSVTTFTSFVLPASEGLVRFFKANGEDSDVVANLAAHYGTILHILIGDFLRGLEINPNPTHLKETVIIPYLIDNLVNPYYADSWAYKLENDILSFAQFAYDKELEPIAIEFPIISSKYELMGQIDLIAKVKFGKSKVIALIDFKSGRKGFYDSHELQLHIYKDAWNENLGNVCSATHCFNWSPKEWTKEPTYNFQNQTESIQASLLDSYYKIAKAKGFYDFAIPTIMSSKPLALGKKPEITFRQLNNLENEQN